MRTKPGTGRDDSASAVRIFLTCICLAGTFATSACRAQNTWHLWDSHGAKYLDAQGRVIDHAAEDQSTTEGRVDGMFFGLVANDRALRQARRVDRGQLGSGPSALHLGGYYDRNLVMFAIGWGSIDTAFSLMDNCE